MKKMILLSALLLSPLAHADYVPVVGSRYYATTVSVGGGFAVTQENAAVNGPMGNLAWSIYNAPLPMQQSLDAFVKNAAAANGGAFLGSTLSSPINVSLVPDGLGAVTVGFSGFRYDAQTKFSGKKYGVLKYDCINKLGLNNLSGAAKYGASDGVYVPGSFTLNYWSTSSTECDSNISWILPVFGNMLIDSFTGKLDKSVAAATQATAATLTDSLFYFKDANLLNGLQRLIPVSQTVNMTNGQVFPIGQYVHANMPYLLANATITATLGKPVQVSPAYGLNEPVNSVYSSDALRLTVSSPAITFSMTLSDTTVVYWDWRCSLANPSRVCQQP